MLLYGINIFFEDSKTMDERTKTMINQCKIGYITGEKDVMDISTESLFIIHK